MKVVAVGQDRDHDLVIDVGVQSLGAKVGILQEKPQFTYRTMIQFSWRIRNSVVK